MLLIPSRSLCSTCTACIAEGVGFAFYDADKSTYRYRHHRSMTSWRSSREARCLMCTTVWDALTRDQQMLLDNFHGEAQLTFLDFEEGLPNTPPGVLHVHIWIQPAPTALRAIKYCRKFQLDPRPGKI